MTQPADRYEPLPSLPELPRWLWRKLGRRGRITIVLAALAVAAAAAATVPGLRESQREADARTQRDRAAQRGELVRRLEIEQRPVSGRSGSRDAGRTRPDRLATRAAVMGDLGAAIETDARGRARRGELTGTIRRVTCEPFPRTVGGNGANEDLGRRRGRFACVAVTAEFARTEGSPGGVIGHRYRAKVDFPTGRYTFCKITGRAGPEREQVVTIPRACGG